MNRETMINALIEDYGDYLSDFTDEEIELIINNGVFTLREAKRLEQADKGI